VGISIKTQKMLWGRAASRCAFPDCKKELVMDASETDDESLVGEACHIVARKQDGPRGESDLNLEQRDKYNNLLILCNIHHKLIDDQPGEYTVERLLSIKKEHEDWVKKQLQIYDPGKQRDDEVYASYIEEFEKYIDIENWCNWTSWLLSHGQPQIGKEIKQKLDQLRTWLLNRIWPQRYKNLELSFENFRRVLQDLLNVFDEHSVEFGDDGLITEKFYQIDDWNPAKYDRLFKQWEYHCYLVEDLATELNRAANYIFDKVRENLLHSYRLKEGALLIMSGPHDDLTYKTFRAEYRGEERAERPYPGLEEFKSKIRFTRDLYFGKET
jgi:hypothetical protein